jgi:hypothetical protein
LYMVLPLNMHQSVFNNQYELIFSMISFLGFSGAKLHTLPAHKAQGG